MRHLEEAGGPEHNRVKLVNILADPFWQEDSLLVKQGKTSSEGGSITESNDCQAGIFY